MIWEVTAKILFSIEDEARDFYHDCQLALAKGVAINIDSPNTEVSLIELMISNHELDPNKPSELLLSETSITPTPD